MTCFTPYRKTVSGSLTLEQRFPCGRCGACRANRAQEWANRLCWEAEEFSASSFLTLTFSEENEPSDQCVQPRDLQLFFKRLRKFLDGRKIKYFAVGEYGETYGRPHYHAVILGLDSVSDRVLVEKAWNLGFVQVSDFNRGRARYVTGYLLKQVDARISLFGRVPPFALMSKGMGFSYALKNAARIREHDVLTQNGFPIRVPKYFKRKLEVEPLLHNDYLQHVLVVHGKRTGSTDRRDLVLSIDDSLSQAERNFIGKERTHEREESF